MPSITLAQVSNAVIGSAQIHAPAVILQYNKGTLTIISLNITKGNGSVMISGPNATGNSTIFSANTAVAAASKYLKINMNDYNFNYHIYNVTNVSGPSAGTAMALLVISAYTHKPIPNNVTVTGTISYNGTVGEIGGVYDKINAAALNGITYAVVPYAQNGSFENMLYYITQQKFGIPLDQVSNLSQAASFIFNYSGPMIRAHKTVYNPFTYYDLTNLPNANISCSNNCSSSAIGQLANFTLGMVENQTINISNINYFRNISSLMEENLNQSRNISKKGYNYLAADLAFLQYIDGYVFQNSATSRYGALAKMQNISNYCATLNAPQMTNSNYEYVIGGNLRALWGSYMINSDISAYNATNSDTDTVLYALMNAAEAKAWCNSASFMYNFSSNMGGNPVNVSSKIKELAYLSIINASNFNYIKSNSTINPILAYKNNKYICIMPGDGCLYLNTAIQAYLNNSYATALVDANYVPALYSTTITTSNATAYQISRAQFISKNATFGIWATQFADESQFYVHQSALSNSSELKGEYASQAYSTALLSFEMSNSMQLISNNFIPEQSKVGGTNMDYSLLINILFIIFILMIISIIIEVVVLVLLVSLLKRTQKGQKITKKIKK